MALLESTLLAHGIAHIAGVDEAGRGPCAGPLVVAAVILENPLDSLWKGIKDSKKLTESRREELFELIMKYALAFAIIEIPAAEIDEVGLHRSNLEGMRRAVQALSIRPEYVLSDGYAITGLDIPTLAVWKGDQVALTVGAASILAKVYRDRMMLELDLLYPEYGSKNHKGYITAQHSRNLIEFGPCDIHRRSFSNIASLLPR